MLALDFETTGLDASQHSIVSIGLVPFTLDGIQLSQAKHWVVRPKLPLHQTSVTIHGITHSDIDKAPDLEEILEGAVCQLSERPHSRGALPEHRTTVSGRGLAMAAWGRAFGFRFSIPWPLRPTSTRIAILPGGKN